MYDYQLEELPERMVDQLRLCTAKAIQGGYSEFDARAVPMAIEYGRGNIVHRTHHPLIFSRPYLEAIFGDSRIGEYPSWYFVYRTMCNLDVLMKEDREGREPLAFLCSIILSLPEPEKNPYKARQPLAQYVTRKHETPELN